MTPPTFADLTEEFPDPSTLPPLDRPGELSLPLTAAQKEWVRDGVVHLPAFLPEELVDDYVDAIRGAMYQGTASIPIGYPYPTPYMQVPALRNLALYDALMLAMKNLIGEDMGLHLNLTGWNSTERNWHQDDYLNPYFVNCYYVAAWIALHDIDPASGPFEYIPGSHRWPLMRQAKVLSYLEPRERDDDRWPKISERFCVPAVETEIARRGIASRTFIAKKGDVLLWHSRLMHRGSNPRVPGMLRKTLIAHYSALRVRTDMPTRAFNDRDGSRGAYFVLDGRSQRV
jgi:hypothetical protein